MGVSAPGHQRHTRARRTRTARTQRSRSVENELGLRGRSRRVDQNAHTHASYPQLLGHFGRITTTTSQSPSRWRVFWWIGIARRSQSSTHPSPTTRLGSCCRGRAHPCTRADPSRYGRRQACCAATPSGFAQLCPWQPGARRQGGSRIAHHTALATVELPNYSYTVALRSPGLTRTFPASTLRPGDAVLLAAASVSLAAPLSMLYDAASPKHVIGLPCSLPEQRVRSQCALGRSCCRARSS